MKYIRHDIKNIFAVPSVNCRIGIVLHGNKEGIILFKRDNYLKFTRPRLGDDIETFYTLLALFEEKPSFISGPLPQRANYLHLWGFFIVEQTAELPLIWYAVGLGS